MSQEETTDIESTDILEAAVETELTSEQAEEKTESKLTDEEKRKIDEAEYIRSRRINEMAILVDENGLVKAKNTVELLRSCKAMVSSDMVPQRFNTPRKLFGALMFVRSLGLPDSAIRQTAIIDGEPSIFGDLPLALAQQSGELFDFEEIWFDEDYKPITFANKNLKAAVFGAVVTGRRGRDGKLREVAYTLDEAKTAGLYPPMKRNEETGADELDIESAWHTNLKMMLRYRARAPFLKSLFADKINGVGITEYDFNMTEETLRDVTPSRGHSANEFEKRMEEMAKQQKKQAEGGVNG